MSAKSAFDTARTNLWMFPPDELLLVEDKSDPLYDPRVHMPLDHALVQNILYQGVLEPVVVIKREGKPIVVDGRQRVRAAREATRLSQERGGIEIRVPAVLRRSDDKGLMSIMISANEIRQSDGPLQRAEKCRRLLEAGYVEEELQTIFGVTKNTISNWLSLFEVAPAVRDAIERGELAASAAPQLKNLSEKKQLAAIKAAKKTNRKGHASAKAVRDNLDIPKTPRMRNRAEIENRLQDEKLPAEYRGALCWVLRRQE